MSAVDPALLSVGRPTEGTDAPPGATEWWGKPNKNKQPNTGARSERGTMETILDFIVSVSTFMLSGKKLPKT